ncbi:MAG TPA: hypothetical protein VLS28_08160 [Candidatus Sulfomarinibacteraceae bacterium]|nr:hypothetical protein [Candidatus Sulfomarinibacteraceae bacterium]
MTELSGLIERTVGALGRLAALGETIEDEWTYVHDLETVWTAGLRAVAAAERPAAALPPPAELEAAVDRLVAEAGLVTDPHRAIDWLSTLPQATLIALGEAAW